MRNPIPIAIALGLLSAPQVSAQFVTMMPVELARPLKLTDTTMALAKFRAQDGDIVHLEHDAQRQREIVRIGKRLSCARITDDTSAFPYACEYRVTRDLDSTGPNTWTPHSGLTALVVMGDPTAGDLIFVSPRTRPPCPKTDQPRGTFAIGCAQPVWMVPVPR